MTTQTEHLRRAHLFLRAMFRARDSNMKRLWHAHWRAALRNANRKDPANA